MRVLDDPSGTASATMPTAKTMRRRDVAAARPAANVYRPRRDRSSFAAKVALLPEVVEAASHLDPTARIRHIAFAGSLAFGRLGGDAEAHLDLDAYGAALRTAKRLAADAPSGLVWEEWEVVYLMSACAALMGRRRRSVTRTCSTPPDSLLLTPTPSAPRDRVAPRATT